MDSTEKPGEKEMAEVPSFGGMLPLIAGMYCSAGQSQSRKHEIQQLIFMMLKPSQSEAEARSFLADMKDALASTEKAVDVMVW